MIVLVAVGWLSLATSAEAAPGDLLYSVPLLSSGKGSPTAQGLTFDGKNLWFSDPWARSYVAKVDQSTGATIMGVCPRFSGTLCGDSSNPRIGGLEWDTNQNVLWAGEGYAGPSPAQMHLYKIDPVSGIILQTLDVATPGLSTSIVGDKWISGVTFDPTNSTIWYSFGTKKVYHVDTLGNVLGDISVPASASVGEAFANGNLYHNASQSWGWNEEEIIKTSQTGSFLWKTPRVSSLYSDLAYSCDRSSSIPALRGVPVVWSINNNRFNAVEVPEPSCLQPLGVRWDYYYAQRTDGGISINWQTLMEQDTSGFIIERSISEFGTYEIINPFIDAHGPMSPYSWLDEMPDDGAEYWYYIQELTSNGVGDRTPAFVSH